jgi:HK97 family phage prohead protease
VSEQTSPPRENLIRAVMPGVEFREDPHVGGDGNTLFGHFARFNEWTEINSMWEGRFMERFAPGAFKKTIRETGDSGMRVLFQHGQDPQIGDKPIAAISDLREDDQGAYYEARLFNGLPPLVMDGLRANQYGASFRFGVLREQLDQDPGTSDYNPLGLPERTVKEARVPEFGPVTFPAYANASAGVRSLTDDFLMRCFERDPVKLRTMFARATVIGARMDSEDVGTLASMLQCASEYIAEQDEGTPEEAAAATAMQAIQGELIKLLNVEAAETEPDEPDEESGRSTQHDAPSTTDAALSTSGPERRDHASARGPLALPTRTERAGLTLTTTERKATWPLR